MNKLGVYIHIPFCVRKCKYCDFPSFGGTTSLQRKTYVELLEKEIQSNREALEDHTIDTIFIGGGTPSLLEVEWMDEIMQVLMAHAKVSTGAEISMECNPGTVKAGVFEQYKRMGINRISFGVQSANANELRCLGRIHTFDDFLHSFELARKAEIRNINVDMMSGIPEQTLSSYQRSLQKVIACEPEHISAYSLIIEEGTPFAVDYRDRSPVTEEVDRQMYHFTKEFLHQSGYERYEISNYAKSGYECRHNLKYWNLEDYVGFGLSAASCLENVRWQNATTMEEYAIGKKESHLCTMGEQMEEYMFLGLRKCDGISKEKFDNKFKIHFDDIYGEKSDKLIQQGLLQQEGNRISLTEWGMDVSNQVMCEFLLDD